MEKENELSKLSDRELMVVAYDLDKNVQQKSEELYRLKEKSNFVNAEMEKRVVEEKQRIINLKNTDNASIPANQQ